MNLLEIKNKVNKIRETLEFSNLERYHKLLLAL